MENIIIDLKKVTKVYDDGENKIKAIDDINLTINKGDLVVILGPSGCGKSTLLNIIGGIEKADAGEIIVNDKSITKINTNELLLYRRDNIGFVFQFYNLISDLTVKENIEVCEYLSKNPLPIDNLIKTLGLWEQKDKFPNQLSGGQQQRCAIGRALVKKPKILLCDEPTGAIDYETSKGILGLIENINQKYHTTVIIVTHNEAIKNMAHKVIKLHNGKTAKEYRNEIITKAKDLEW